MERVDFDVVAEFTELLLDERDSSQHIKLALKIIMSAPSKDATLCSFTGANHTTYARSRLLSLTLLVLQTAIPIAKVLKRQFGIVKGLMTTVHAATAAQKTVKTVLLRKTGEVVVVS